MPPRLNLLHRPLCIALRPRPINSIQSGVHKTAPPTVISIRSITADEKPLPEAEQPKGPNQEQLPHVSEEAATMGKITGEGGPEIEQGTPVQEILKRDTDAQEKAPQVIQDDMKSTSPKGTRSYSTSARRLQEQALVTMEDDADITTQGHKFALPELPLPSNANLKHRYDPVVQQVTNLLMQDGKLSVAQRNMSLILAHLRTAPPPTITPARPLLPSAPPPSHLPLNPILYLTLAIDSVAPLLRIRSQKGAAGGGIALQIPVPLGLRQRRKKAVEWILDAATKRRSRGSGRGGFAQKVAEEIVSVVEGKSGVWDRRGGVHKLGVSARANLAFGGRRR
ncbi:MAG: hypothetical protein M1827_005578 [Pycnora praestabilis]|nr:MAG: hypothetical protein M1827_005578 [Pycnora praestabilis]